MRDELAVVSTAILFRARLQLVRMVTKIHLEQGPHVRVRVILDLVGTAALLLSSCLHAAFLILQLDTAPSLPIKLFVCSACGQIVMDSLGLIVSLWCTICLPALHLDGLVKQNQSSLFLAQYSHRHAVEYFVVSLIELT